MTATVKDEKKPVAQLTKLSLFRHLRNPSHRMPLPPSAYRPSRTSSTGSPMNADCLDELPDLTPPAPPPPPPASFSSTAPVGVTLPWTCTTEIAPTITTTDSTIVINVDTQSYLNKLSAQDYDDVSDADYVKDEDNSTQTHTEYPDAQRVDGEVTKIVPDTIEMEAEDEDSFDTPLSLGDDLNFVTFSGRDSNSTHNTYNPVSHVSNRSDPPPPIYKSTPKALIPTPVSEQQHAAAAVVNALKNFVIIPSTQHQTQVPTPKSVQTAVVVPPPPPPR